MKPAIPQFRNLRREAGDRDAGRQAADVRRITGVVTRRRDFL
jgi:hypothetical protein